MPPRKKLVIQASDSDDAFSEDGADEVVRPKPRSAAAPMTRASTSAPTLVAASSSRPVRAAARSSAAHITSELTNDDEEEDELAGSDEDDDQIVDEPEEEEDELDELQSDSPEEDEEKPKAAPARGPPKKLKLKLGKAPAKPAALRRVQSESRPSKKAKKRAEEVESEEDEDEESGSDSTESETSSASLARMTARQRAGALGPDKGGEEALLELPSKAPRIKFSGLSTDEANVKRLANIQKRKDRQAQKMEDEKQDTINRLLNKQPGHGKGTGKGRKRKIVEPAAGEEDELAADGTPRPAAEVAAIASQPVVPTLLRYVQPRDGPSLLSIPPDLVQYYAPQPARSYPGPRRPPVSRRLVPAS